jgi:hypothetical protein
MLAAEKQPAGKPLYRSAFKECCDDPHELGDHVHQLIKAGLLDGAVYFYPRLSPKILVHRITPAGHEFLRVMREDTTWKKVKDNFIKTAANWTLQLALEYAKKLIREP